MKQGSTPGALLALALAAALLPGSLSALADNRDGRDDDDHGGHGGSRRAAWQVDDDRRQCPDADFTSINAAVAAAAPGDTIEVCPGLYNESVLANKTLRLQGTIRSRNPLDPHPSRDSIVDPPDGSPGFRLDADRVTVEQFVVQGATGNAGISTDEDFSGYRIERNVIRDNTFGVYLNSSGEHRSEVEGNLFFANNRPGSASGDGIYSDQGLHNAVIERNTFSMNASAGIVLVGITPGDVSRVSVTRNASSRDGSFAALFGTTFVEVSQNGVSESVGAGIFVGNDNTLLEISRNTLTSGNEDGILFLAEPFGGPNVGVEVSRNQIRRMRLSGIAAAPNSLEDSLLTHNQAFDNGQDGIRIEAGGNAGNRITHNHMLRNREHDAHDDTVGTGTAGTANHWSNNQCRTENRPGLCKHPSR